MRDIMPDRWVLEGPWTAHIAVTDTCPICGNRRDNRGHRTAEMMFGTREPFSYLECGACGALSLCDPPDDLSPYYPSGYYSYEEHRPPARSLGRLVRRLRTELLLHGGRPLFERATRRPAPAFADWMEGLSVSTTSRIVDIGSGSGRILLELADEGFVRLLGTDPYLPRDRSYGPVKVLRLEFSALRGRFDLVMLHHSFEHMAAPGAVLGRLGELLAPRGAILVRVPVADSFAWGEYGTDWVGLDPPRHLHVHTRRSIALLADRAGLVVRRVFHDSFALQFWGSELYRRGIPLRPAGERPELVFAQEELDAWEERSQELNARGEGDAAGFLLQRRP